jgi:phage-related minor tail protein
MGTIGGAALIGLGAVALKIGNDFDEAADSIAAATGKTGDELDALNKQMLNAFKTLPVSMKDAATAIGDLNSRLGLPGKTRDDRAA